MLKTVSVKNNLNEIQSTKLKESYSLAILSFFCLSMYALRVYLSGSYYLLFLAWNLFLAFVPWAISTVLLLSTRMRNLKLISLVFGLFWILFFPNAPYIITDLVHLRNRSNMPIWFDLVLILTFAWTGLLYGFYSMKDMAFLCKKKINVKLVNVMIGSFLFVTSFGVYIGRYLRWNSWDIVNRPSALVADLVEVVSNPAVHPRAWGMTLLMGFMLNIIYWTFRSLSDRKV